MSDPGISPKQNQLLLAVAFALFNACMLSSMGLFGKLLGQYFGPIEVTFFRSLSSMILLVGMFTVLGKFALLKTNRPWAHLLRSMIGTAGIIIGMWAFILLPLAMAVMLFFTCPLFVVLLSPFVLGERFGIYRISAVIAGFLGVLVISWPVLQGTSNDEISAFAILIGLIYAFSAACVDMCLRWIGKTENSSTTTFYFLLFGLFSTSLYWPFAPVPKLDVTFETYAIIFGLGLTGVLSLLSKSQSYRLGEASVIAPITYTMIIWAMLYDYFIWGRVPGIELFIGGFIIIASNLFILWREHKKSKQVIDTANVC